MHFSKKVVLKSYIFEKLMEILRFTEHQGKKTPQLTVGKRPSLGGSPFSALLYTKWRGRKKAGNRGDEKAQTKGRTKKQAGAF